MRAAVVPAVNARWEVREIPVPEPGPTQVLIRIRASGLCYTDVHIASGALGVKFPHVLGHEPVGEIVAVGSAVATRKKGDRVGVPWVQAGCGRCEWCLRGKPMFCANAVGTGIQTQGSHAEYMLAEATVWSGFRIAQPRPRDRVAVVGVGGLGHLAVQYAKAAGFDVIAMTHSKDKEALLRQLGADEVVHDGRGLAEAGGADVILATSNSYAPVTDAIQGLRPEGRLVLMGVAHEPLSVPTSIMWVRGSVLGSVQNSPEHLYEALDYVARGKVKVMAETYPLSDVARAYDRVKAGSVRFRAVIVP
ncbi:MAG: alcohol dehydrogenase [Acidobacteria bacterium]|nr:MAG: alcohol dehydrogenase [Acidobacteriota bacterium]